MHPQPTIIGHPSCGQKYTTLWIFLLDVEWSALATVPAHLAICIGPSSKCCKSAMEVGTYIVGVRSLKVQHINWIKVPCEKPSRKLLFSQFYPSEVLVYLLVCLSCCASETETGLLSAAVNVTFENYKKNGQAAFWPRNVSCPLARMCALFRIIISIRSIAWCICVGSFITSPVAIYFSVVMR